MLDKNSLGILIELCREGDLTNAELAKRLNINPATVAKKKQKLLKDGVIEITALSNPEKMGYVVGAFIGLEVDLNKIDFICHKLSDNIKVNMVIMCFGRFDILISAYFYDMVALQTFVKTELPEIDGINRIETFLVAEPREQHHRRLPTDKNPLETVRLNKMDQIIVNELLQTRHFVYSDLAKKLGVSLSTVSRRIHYLISNGVIFFRAKPNPSKIGYTANAFILLKAELSKVEKICDELVNFHEVYLIMKLMNDYEVIFGVQAVNTEVLFEFIKSKVAPIDGVLKIDTLIRGPFHHFRAAPLFIPS
jgi:Lrp/AsnC family transcriptional regulator, leucine-responsive regulatory protein